MSGAQGEDSEDNTPDDIPDTIPKDNPDAYIPPKAPAHLTLILNDIFLGKDESGRLCSYKNQVFCTVR